MFSIKPTHWWLYFTPRYWKTKRELEQVLTRALMQAVEIGVIRIAGPTEKGYKPMQEDIRC